MLTKAEILLRLQTGKPELLKFGISRIGLFGSYAHNAAKASSDIDIIIDFNSNEETFDNFMKTCTILETIFQGQKIDIVTIKGLSPYIGPIILNETEYV